MSDSATRLSTATTQPQSERLLTLDQQFARLFDLDELPYISRFAWRHIEDEIPAAAPVPPRPPTLETAAKSIAALTLGVAAALLFLAMIIAFFALRPR